MICKDESVPPRFKVNAESVRVGLCGTLTNYANCMYFNEVVQCHRFRSQHLSQVVSEELTHSFGFFIKTNEMIATQWY